MNQVLENRLDYPRNHIEVDNRLCYCLGRLDEKYGDDAVYVHLTRNELATAKSFLNRWGSGVIRAYAYYILQDTQHENENDHLDVCRDYVDAMNANIRLFLKDKTKVVNVHLENPQPGFERFWELIGAEGDKQAALAQWQTAHNAS
jgi:hypothetical protein